LFFLLLAGLGAVLLLQRPILGLLVIIVAALIIPINIGTGTEVKLNPVSLFIPALLAIWLLDMIGKRNLRLVRSRTFLPLFLLMLAGVGSLLIGNATWDPFVPRPANFLLVQLAQLGIFFLSIGAYLLVANLVKDEIWLRYITWTFLVVGGGLAMLSLWPAGRTIIRQIATVASNRAPMWMLLTAVAGGQLLFNKSLVLWKQLIMLLILAAVGFYSFVLHREVISVWIGVLTAAAMLFWLRWPRFRWLVLLMIIILLITGVLFPAVYEFAGGDAEWRLSGLSRIDLSRRVIEVTMRNPITGLGPASYRVYASMEPLVWRSGKYVWIGAVISSHNNYVDLFSHVGLLGMAIFFWFMAEVGLQALRLRKRKLSGFVNGYINGALAAWIGILLIMLFADWFLPFVYNVGFPGFQASVLVWMYLGGIVAINTFLEKDLPPS
jgi:O-antigen ligase